MVNQAKTIKILAFAIYIAIGNTVSGLAQDRKDVVSYLKDSGPLSTLMRGQKPAQYTFLYNGTPYIESPEFKKGDLRYNGRTYFGVLLNIDAAAMDALVKTDANVAATATLRRQTAWLKIENRLFVNLEFLEVEMAPEGYCEVVLDGETPIVKFVTKTLRTQTGNHNGKDIGMNDPEYREDVPSYFRQEEVYYIIKGNTAKRISARKARMAVSKAAHRKDGISWFNEEKLNRVKGSKERSAGHETYAFKPSGLGLPDGYFSRENEKASVPDTYDETYVKASYRNKIYTIGKGKNSGKARVSGSVRDLESKEMLAGVLVYDNKTSTHTLTEKGGRYSLTLPVGENVINFSLEGKETISLMVEIEGDGLLDIDLPDKIELLKASIVSATSMESHHTTTMGVEEVSMKTMNRIPSAFGEGDILRSVLTLPGVKTAGEAAGGFNVRGGSQDQNLILFNDNTIYNPNHLFGLFSAFNPDVVENVELYKSSIPAEYGGRISSVMIVRSKQGNTNKFKGSAGIGLLTSRLHLEGPIAKGKTSFILAGRMTYSDWILRLMPKDSYYSNGSANFYDINAGITHRFTDSDVLSFNAYSASDKFSFSADTLFRNKNLNLSLNYRHKGRDGSAFSMVSGYDRFENNTGLYAIESLAYDLRTRIEQVFVKGSRTQTVENHAIMCGADIVGMMLSPGSIIKYGEQSLINDKSLAQENGIEPALFISDNWSISDKVSAEGGVRLSAFLSLADKSFFGGPEFRFSARYSPLPNLSFKGGINTMRQNIHLITNTAAISPMDTWKLSEAGIKPTTGWQGAAGAYWTQLSTGIDFSAELYWKETANEIDYKSGATLVMNENLADDLVPVQGRSYGIELMMKKSTGSITGWLSYCYSRAMLREIPGNAPPVIAHGEWYNAPHDKPHEVKLATNWALTHRYSISVNLDYSTGRPITVPSGHYYFGGAWRLAYSQRNSHRIPDYFRIDAALNIDPGHYLKAIAHSSITIGVYNITGRHNPYSVFFRNNTAGQIQGYMLSVFATQIPYINLNILF